MLQLLPLAQTAWDYLKPQPFIYEKREPDIRLIDGHLLKYQLVQYKEKLTFSAWIMELFLDLWTFLVPSLIEVVRWSHLLINRKEKLVLQNLYTKGACEQGEEQSKCVFCDLQLKMT